MIGESFERASYHFEARIDLIRDYQPDICNTSILSTHEQMCLHHGYRPIQGRSMRQIKKHGYQNTSQIHVIEDSNLGHSYQKYTVDLCQMNTNSSIAMTIQIVIHGGTSYNILHCNLGESYECFQHISRVFVSTSIKYDSIHVITMI